MPKLDFEQLNTVLDQSIENGIIYNADFNELKTYEAGRTWEKEHGDVRRKLIYDVPQEERFEWGSPEDEAIDAIGYNFMSFPSKKFKTLLGNLDPNSDVARGLTEFMNRWEPVRDKFLKLKNEGMIQKGRKPSETPRKTPIRTLENTGTCAICGQNVKMSGGRLVAHGYRVRWGYQEGNCFGVGYKPIETSPEAMQDYLKMLAKVQEDIRQSLKKHQEGELPVPSQVSKKMVGPDDASYARLRSSFISGLERDIRFIGMDMNDFQKKIDTWKAGPLPG